MIFVTGDRHGEFARFVDRKFPIGRDLTKNDYVIVCGDFGYWTPSQELEEKLDWLDRMPWTTLFVDGNHEDFDELYALPVEEWHGGQIHRVRPSIIHLMRGEYFENVDGKSVFAFGGAASHDVNGGIYHVIDINEAFQKQVITMGDIVPEERQALDDALLFRLPFRIEHISWWKEEVPSEKEFKNGIRNLKAHNNKADIVISHDGPQSVVSAYSRGFIKPDRTREYLEKFKNKIEYKKWFFGHHHYNVRFGEKNIMLYEDIVQM